MLKYTPSPETPERLRKVMLRLARIVREEGLMASIVITDGTGMANYDPTDPDWSAIRFKQCEEGLLLHVIQDALSVSMEPTVQGLVFLYTGLEEHRSSFLFHMDVFQKFTGQRMPDTIEEAAGLLEDWMTEEERQWALRTPLYDAMPHIESQGFGLQLREKWSGGDPVKMRADLLTRFGLFGHTDDLLPLILTVLWSRVRKEPAEVLEAGLALETDGMRAHWRSQGINPETGERGLVL